jgi:hypothetical protein
VSTRSLTDLAPNPKNPRLISTEKLELLKAALTEFGDLGGVVYNRTSKQLVGGHQRIKVFGKGAKLVVDKEHSKPTKVGTVAEGYVFVNGERFRYREVEWDEIKEKAANIAANRGAGEWNLPELSTWLREIDSFGYDLNLTMFGAEEREQYLRDVDAINKGDENEAWAQMGDEHEFKPGGGYTTIIIHFKSEKDREGYAAKHKLNIESRSKAAWTARA